MQLLIDVLPARADNYIFMLRCQSSGAVAVVDPCSASPVVDYLGERNLSLDVILNTHHHHDHVGGNMELKALFGAKVYGSASDEKRIPGLDVALSEGETFLFGSHLLRVLETSGHTLGAICFFFEASRALFCGDTLFSLGCGRLFEGTAVEMWQSLVKISELPFDTQVYCAHEYTEKNAEFAMSVEPENTDLEKRYAQVRFLRASNKPSIPTTIGLELATNPFLRVAQANIRNRLKMENAPDVDVFSQLRSLKDHF